MHTIQTNLPEQLPSLLGELIYLILINKLLMHAVIIILIRYVIHYTIHNFSSLPQVKYFDKKRVYDEYKKKLQEKGYKPLPDNDR